MCIDWMVGFHRNIRTICCYGKRMVQFSDIDVDGIQTPEGGQLAVRERINVAVQFEVTEVQL